MVVKKQARLRRARRARGRIRARGLPRLSVYRTPRHIYAQLLNPEGSCVLAAASTLESGLRDGVTGNRVAAARVGTLIAERVLAAGIDTVAFDRSGYRYHGRVQALAQSARDAGLAF